MGEESGILGKHLSEGERKGRAREKRVKKGLDKSSRAW